MDKLGRVPIPQAAKTLKMIVENLDEVAGFLTSQGIEYQVITPHQDPDTSEVEMSNDGTFTIPPGKSSLTVGGVKVAEAFVPAIASNQPSASEQDSFGKYMEDKYAKDPSLRPRIQKAHKEIDVEVAAYATDPMSKQQRKAVAAAKAHPGYVNQYQSERSAQPSATDPMSVQGISALCEKCGKPRSLKDMPGGGQLLVCETPGCETAPAPDPMSKLKVRIRKTLNDAFQYGNEFYGKEWAQDDKMLANINSVLELHTQRIMALIMAEK
jgi:hypothetical protein